MSDKLRIESRDAADWLTLSRPDKLNALDAEMGKELLAYFAERQHDYHTRVIVLRGEGRGFCAGLDLASAGQAPGFRDEDAGHQDFATSESMAFQRSWSDIVLRMRRCPQPIVSLIHGAASGLGFALALASDIRIAGESARMNAAFIRIGLSGGDCGSSYHLPRLVGGSIASELLLTGRFIDAERALRTGLISELVPDSELEKAGESMVADILRNAPLGVRLTKDMLNASQSTTSLDQHVALEDRSQVLTLAAGDPGEGARAFLQKRDPNYAD
jgi:enoyl-CoA hydratase/carnithine racemase